ncbi:MAG: multiubiquitin domain-containing protein [Bacteroidetes bacterium]|jgi:hypothetical protein|nr:multiubiquitin domain-containing protein [Bacteroidota bacterium]
MSNEDKKPKEVSIHIDKKEYKSPSPTTGAALYILGSIDATTYDLFLEVKGKGDDEPIENDTKEVDLKDGDHLYTAQKNLNPGA